MAVIISSGTSTVSKGQVLADPTIISSGRVNIISGGTMTGPKVSNGGKVHISNGGSAVNGAYGASGWLYISEGGVCVNPTISSGAILNISGGIIRGGTFNGEDYTLYGAGSRVGFISGATLNKARLFVSSGGRTSDVVMTSNAAVIVLSGGMVQATIVSGSGQGLYVYANGSAHLTKLFNGAEMRIIDSGGTATATEVKGASLYVDGGVAQYISGTGGQIVVNSNGLISSAVLSNAHATVRNGTALDTQVSSGGRFYLSSGATATRTRIFTGGDMWVESCTADVVTVSSGGSVEIQVSGTVSSATVTGGEFTIAGGKLVNATFASGSLGVRGYGNHQGIASQITLDGYTTVMTVSSGGVASGALMQNGQIVVNNRGTIRDTVAGAGYVSLNGGGSASNTTLYGGSMSVSGTATTNRISGGLLQVNGGMAVDNTVTSNGVVVVSAGGQIKSTVVSSGCTVYIIKGIASDTTVSSGAVVRVSSGGTANLITVSSGALVHVSSGGTANLITVQKGADLQISATASATGIVENGGCVNIFDGGYATFASNTFSGAVFSATVHSGTTANNVTVTSKGKLEVFSGGKANKVTVSELGASLDISGGVVSSATVSGTDTDIHLYDGGKTVSATVGSGADFRIESGCSAITTTVNAGAQMIVSGGAVASHTVENGGYVEVYSGATATFAANTFSGAVLSATAHSNTRALNVTVERSLAVFEGGSAAAVTIGSGASVWVHDGAVADGVTLAGRNAQLIVNHATVTSAVLSGIDTKMALYGTASSTTANAGLFQVYSGGTANDVNVGSGGKIQVLADGKVTGKLTIQAGAVVEFNSRGTLDFDLTRTTVGGAALVNDLSDIIYCLPKYTLTVDGTQADGDYKLAGNAGNFDTTEIITVKDTEGGSLGTLTVGQTASINGANYTLNLGGDNVLSVTVGSVEPGPSGTAKSDVNGNGISDVMFIWTGNDYAHGYWLDGTNEWRSTGSNHPAEWENLGCYDMTGDGKADSVLVGNVVVEGVKGAYIGYYADAIDAIDGSTWVNIDYLNNEANITWVNKIGNLTGGSANSIVWYAPELFTLGAWTDGTSNWVTMTGSFGGDDWKLVGCGDFDGDGKDSVVMSGAGGAYFYAADLDGAVTSLGAANWSGWTVRAIGDFLGDGKDDMVMFHEETGSMVMLADGSLDDFTSIGQLDAQDWFVVGAGDYNADAKDDLLVRQYSTGMLGYYSGGDVANGWVELGRGVGMEWTVIA